MNQPERKPRNDGWAQRLSLWVVMIALPVLFALPSYGQAQAMSASASIDRQSSTTSLAASTAVTTTVASTVTTTSTADPFAAWNSRTKVTREQAYPVRIVIPALGIDTAVEAMGERQDGAMATPTDPDQVAWYSYGAIPGENGSVVMAGHLDKADGSPAIFWELGKLAVGDEIVITDSSGARYRYVVTGQQRYPYHKAPLQAIFGFDLASRLNLITCQGAWDHNRQTYSQRLVVTSELVAIIPK